MNLDAAQKQKVAAWIEAGLKLAEIQGKLASELGLRLTYMEVRFLLDDLKLKLKEEEPPTPPAKIEKDVPAEKTPAAGPPPQATPDLAEAEPDAGAGVSVTVDQLARPGAVVSGSVKFSDGNMAQWYLDQHGRLGLAPKQQGYKPPPADLMAFQAELQNELAKLGF